MGTISNARAIFGLVGSGSPTRTKVGGKAQIGVAQTQVDLADADICYSFQMTATATSDTARLTLSSGAVAATGGSPTIEDGGGNDFEGETLPTTVEVLALLFQTSADNSGGVAISPQYPPYPDITMQEGETCLWIDPAGDITLGYIDFSLITLGNVLTVTVVAKSS